MAVLSKLVRAMAVLASLGVARGASERVANEYQVKAALLYNFAKFVEWPADAFKGPSDPIAVCVIGENSIGPSLEEIARGPGVGSRVFQVNHVTVEAEARKCHILFVSQSEHGRLGEILRMVATHAVLTVGESDGFLERGGLINLHLKDSRVRFEINVEAAARARCRISSKLLSVSNGQEK